MPDVMSLGGAATCLTVNGVKACAKACEAQHRFSIRSHFHMRHPLDRIRIPRGPAASKKNTPNGRVWRCIATTLRTNVAIGASGSGAAGVEGLEEGGDVEEVDAAVVVEVGLGVGGVEELEEGGEVEVG